MRSVDRYGSEYRQSMTSKLEPAVRRSHGPVTAFGHRGVPGQHEVGRQDQEIPVRELDPDRLAVVGLEFRPADRGHEGEPGARTYVTLDGCRCLVRCCSSHAHPLARRSAMGGSLLAQRTRTVASSSPAGGDRLAHQLVGPRLAIGLGDRFGDVPIDQQAGGDRRAAAGRLGEVEHPLHVQGPG